MSFARARMNTGAATPARVMAVACAATGMWISGSGQAVAEDLLPAGPFTMTSGATDTDKCFGSLPEDDGSQPYRVTQGDCDTSDKQYRWTAEELSDGRFKLHNGSGGCLQWVPKTTSYISRSAYELHDCAKAAQFKVEAASDGTLLFKDGTDLMEGTSGSHLDRIELSFADRKAYRWVIKSIN
ncbi:hypothetical protein ABZ942_13415 [Nocardia sp. NPDC046473]|uniref:RICIN domain-containing protein n=1 Tax=Nocardia sp. NPDC046473 TaxID=3155733 RepID=UPI0033F88895